MTAAIETCLLTRCYGALGTKSGLWWYPLDAPPSLIPAGRTYSVATLGENPVVIGSDVSGSPWPGTVGSAWPGISIASLPPEIASLFIDGGEIASLLIDVAEFAR